MSRAILQTLLLGSLLAIVGCGPPWQVVRQAVPNPMLGKTQFAVAPIDYANLRVGEKSEAEYVAEKDADTREKWVGDKVAMNEEYAKGLMAGAHDEGILVSAGGPAEFIVRPTIDSIEPGFYAAIVNRASETRMTVRITTADGTVLDEITLYHSTPADIIHTATGHRLRSDAEGLGQFTAEYLKSRSAPEAE